MRRLQERKALPEKLSSSQKLRKKTHPEQTSARRLKKDMLFSSEFLRLRRLLKNSLRILNPKV